MLDGCLELLSALSGMGGKHPRADFNGVPAVRIFPDDYVPRFDDMLVVGASLPAGIAGEDLADVSDCQFAGALQISTGGGSGNCRIVDEGNIARPRCLRAIKYQFTKLARGILVDRSVTDLRGNARSDARSTFQVVPVHLRHSADTGRIPRFTLNNAASGTGHVLATHTRSA